ncbi:MAG: HupE/UreJ family protein [Rubrivivax sp.]|nr:HupE/UreJ family protein [Rubrivivax sp.]
MLAAPATAHAHLTSTGLGPLVDGIAHLLLSLEDLLPVVALALLAGLNGPGAGRRVLFVLPLAWLAGGVAGFLGAGSVPPDGITAVSLLALGGLTAASARLTPAWATVLAVALGLLHGGLNGAAIAAAEREPSGLLGIAGTVFVVAALAAAGSLSLRAAWTRVAVRVAGGWIAAIGLLMLGWAVRAVAA